MSRSSGEMPHGGEVVAGFEPVQKEFIDGLSDFGLGGGAFAAYVGGRPVVDLWGGMAGPDHPWERDNLAVIMSSTKGLVTMCAQILVDRGLLNVDLPMAHYWPEFAQAGKSGVTVRHVMTHTSGVLGFDVLKPPLGWDGQGWDDYDAIAAGLAAATPRWEPGTKFGYHAITYGWLMGEIVRRITGQTVGTFFAHEIAGPLALQAWIGTPLEQHDNVAHLHDHLVSGLPLAVRLIYSRVRRRLQDPTTLSGQAFMADGTHSLLDRAEELMNAKVCLSAELPFGNGTATARALARVYAMMAMEGELDGVRILSAEVVHRFGAEVQSLPDQMLLDYALPGLKRMLSRPVRRTCGYLMNPSFGKEPLHFGPNPKAFGHDGAGGQIAFCDVENHVSVGFVRSDLSSSARYSTQLINCLYECVNAVTPVAMGHQEQGKAS
jgi:CubicO group peptidase (beta-lactamase class C family)